MLKYFKRQKSQRSVDNDVASAEKRHSLISTSSFCDEILADDDDKSLNSFSDAHIDEEIFNISSRLSMSIRDIVRDSECITLFVQYLEGKNALALIKFYLDVENFRIAALDQLEKEHRQQSISTSNTCNAQIHTAERDALNDSLDENGRSCLHEEISEAVNNVPELKTLCDLSMHKSLTDDEKSQIYAATNKQMAKNTILPKKACSLHSLTSQLSNEVSQADVSVASVRDAIAIYQKFLCRDALYFVELPVSILSNISLVLCKRQDEECTQNDDGASVLSISAQCFDEAQKYVIDELERLYLTGFLQSPFYCKFCLELINAENDHGQQQQLTVYDILYSEGTLFYFMEFLEQHNERECLDFWTAAINFRKSYINTTPNTDSNCMDVKADAMIIYKKFFSLEADGRLWLSDKLRSRVETAICGTALAEISSCFDLALMVTAKYLEKKYLSSFLKSELFVQYVKDLKAKLQEPKYGIAQTDDELRGLDVLDAQTTTASTSALQYKLSFKGNKQSSLKRRHRKTMSDCSADVIKPISQQNTLLAMQDNSNKQFKHLPNAGTTLSIDSRQLTNPNLLWHRRYSTSGTTGGIDNFSNNGLKFGRINSLGRYERDFETVESFNQKHCGGSGIGGKNHWTLGVSGSKIKNAMRKLVNLPEHKAQEEIAWQIAEMIVNDVTSVTLKNSPLCKDAADDDASLTASKINT